MVGVSYIYYMTKQELARGRNSNKWLLAGLKKPLNLDCLTLYEKDILQQIYNLHNSLMENWDKNSISLGLNVKSKCMDLVNH